MKKTAFIFTFLLPALSICAADILTVVDAFKSGDAAMLTESMDSEVHIALPDNARRGNGAEAITALARFFEPGKVAGFAVAHHADKKETGFIAGKLTTARGDFRVNITYRIKADKILIQTIRIE
jgi:hypothetical protein